MNITMPKQYTEKLKKEKKETGMSFSEILRRAFDVYQAAKQNKDRG